MTAEISRELKELAQKKQLKHFTKSKDNGSAVIEYRSKKVVDFTSWDYLNLRSHKKVVAAVHEALEESTASIPSPRLSSGTRVSHLALEERLAKFLTVESSLVFSSRNQAVFSLITSLMNEVDIIVVDESVTAPVADAAFLVGAAVVQTSVGTEGWKKNLDEILSKHKGRRVYIYLETLSPALGKIAAFDELAPFCVKYGARLIIDDTYSLGAVGLRGAGFIDIAAVHKGHVAALVGTFGFGIPGSGGYIAGSKELCGYLVNRSRTFTSEPPALDYVCAASEASLDLVELATHHREFLSLKSSALSRLLVSCGLRVVSEPKTPLVTVLFSKPSVADELCSFLLSKMFHVERFSTGSPLKQLSGVRFVVNAAHTEEQFVELASALEGTGKNISS